MNYSKPFQKFKRAVYLELQFKVIEMNVGFTNTIKLSLNFKFNFLEKLIEKLKTIKEELYIDNDLLFVLTYMTSISTAHLSRDKLFEMVSEKKEYFSSKYFKKVLNLTKNWHYDYATACKVIARKIRNEKVKRLFNRLANAISTGEPDREVLKNEWTVFKTVRKDEYMRCLESLRKWADAYTSILVSVTLISVVIILAAMIYKSEDPFLTFFMAALASFVSSMFGVFMLFKSAPKDPKTHNLSIKSKEQRLISKLSPILLPIALASLIFLTIIPIALDLNLGPKGLGLVIFGLIILPLGIIGKIDDKKINKRDEAFTGFIRSLGVIISGTGVSIAKALSKIDQRNLGELKDLVLQLHRRLSLGLNPKLCWEKFVGESGSYLIYKLTSIFVDATDMGGDADAIGEIVSSSNLEMVLLRLKRELISSGFVNLLIPLHTAMVGLILFITQIITKFKTLMSMMFVAQLGTLESPNVLYRVPISGLNINLFGEIPIDLLNKYSLAMILILIFVNTIASKVVKGGANYLIYYYGSILSIVSGLLMAVVPPAINWFFSLPSFVGGE